MDRLFKTKFRNLKKTGDDNDEFKINKDAFPGETALRVNRVFDTFNSALTEFYGRIIKPGDKVIDLGSGDESFLKLLKTKNVEAKGYDIDTVDLETSKIPEVDNSIDCVTCISLIEHIKNTSNLLKEVYRILKPDGTLIIVTPNFSYAYKEFYDDPTHINPFTPSKLYSTLKLLNFKDNHILPWIVKKNPKLWRLPMKFFFARYFLIVRGDSTFPIPKLLKGKSKSILSLSKK